MLTVTLPPVWLIPLIVNVLAVLVNAISPLVALVALKLLTAFAPFKVSLPAELVVSALPLINPAPLSIIELLEVRDTLLLPAAILPLMLTAPVLFTEISPVPLCEIPVIVSGAAFVREMTPAPLFAALKLVTVFALPNVVPVAELVVSKAPLIRPASASSIAPAVAVRETLPLVLILPAFSVTLSPAEAEIAPDVLPTLALTRISLPVPVALKVTLPEPFAVTVLPSVSVPPVAVNEILPLDPVLIAPFVVNAPVFVTATSPVPVSLMPVIVKGAAVFVNEIPPVAFVALKLVTVLALDKVVPVAETVVSNAPLIKPAPASSIAPSVAVRETLALVLMLPAFSVTLSPAEAEIAPDVLPTLALTRISLLVPVVLSVTVPEPLAVTVLPIVSVPPVAVNEILPFDPVLIAPFVVNAPVFVTATSPVPVSLIPVTVKGAAVFVNEIPPVAFVALKPVTVLALDNVVPVAETVVSSAPLIKPAPASSIAPSVAVRETLPLVLRLPAFSVTLSPAEAEIVPDVLPTLALTRMSLLVPVALKVTLPEPFAVTVLPSVSVPPVAVNEMLPLDPVLNHAIRC